MSTTTITPEAVQHGQKPRLTFSRVVSAEWTKLLTLRGNYVTAAIMLVVSALMGVAYAASVINSNAALPEGQGLNAARATALTVSAVPSFGTLIVGILAVLILTNEYSSGTIQSTFTAVPKRLPVLLAKLVVVVVTTVALSIVSIVLAYITGTAVLSSDDLSVSLFEPKVLESAASALIVLVVTAVFALMVATIIRSSAASISTVLALIFVLPVLGGFLPTVGDLDLGRLLFSNALSLAAGSIGAPEPDRFLAAFIISAVVWVAVPTVLAVTLLKRRDA